MAQMARDTDQGWQKAAARLAEAFASTDPTPGGGAAAGVSGAIACALARMAAGISLSSRGADGPRRSFLAAAGDEFSGLQARFHRLSGEDAAAFERVMAAYGLPKTEPGRAETLEAALLGAARAPLDIAHEAAGALGKVLRAKKKTLGTVSSDMACAAHLLRAAGLCALENVEVNAALMKDAAAAEGLRARARELRAEFEGAG